MCQPADQFKGASHSNGGHTSESAASASSGKAAAPQSTASLQGLPDERDTLSFEPVQQIKANVELGQFERSLSMILERQLSTFEHKLSSICDVALARLQKHIDEATELKDPDMAVQRQGSQ